MHKTELQSAGDAKLLKVAFTPRSGSNENNVNLIFVVFELILPTTYIMKALKHYSHHLK